MRLKYRNNTAAFIWFFVAIWNMGPVMLIYLSIRDGLPIAGEYGVLKSIAAIAFFCAGVIGFFIYACRQCCVAVSIEKAGTVNVVWRYPFKVKRKSFAIANIQPAQVVKTKDSEGDPYYECQFAATYSDCMRETPSDIVIFEESHSRKRCEQTCQEFNLAIHG